ncbi:hypothetical protein FHX03_005299 [Rhizobium sp. BK456]|nr:hypothetical protein [Rhizobium sp. BK456]
MLALSATSKRRKPEGRTYEFARDLGNLHGAAVDFAIHQPQGEGDVRNVHAHVMMTTRMVGPKRLGDKTLIERENKWPLNRGQHRQHLLVGPVTPTVDTRRNLHAAHSSSLMTSQNDGISDVTSGVRRKSQKWFHRSLVLESGWITFTGSAKDEVGAELLKRWKPNVQEPVTRVLAPERFPAARPLIIGSRRCLDYR